MSDSAQDHAAHDHSKIYLNVLIALAVLTLTTVLVTHIPGIGRWGAILVGMAVAVTKASLVVMFFMHLKYEQRWWAGIVLFPLLLVMIIIGSNLPDTGMNGPGRGEGDPDRTDLIYPADPAIKHAGHAAPAGHK